MTEKDVKTVNQWMVINKPKGCLLTNVELLREFKALDVEFSKLNLLLYILMVDLNHRDEFITLFKSTCKQRAYIKTVIGQIKTYQVFKRFEPIFRRDIRSLKDRIKHVNKIIKINIRLSELYPYFENNGYEILENPTLVMDSWDNETQTFKDAGRKEIISAIKKWNEQHSDIINKHMEEIRPELEAAQRRKEEIAAFSKAEKKRVKDDQKAENAEYKEIKKNEEEYRKRMKKVNREFESYYFSTKMQEAAVYE